MVGADEYERLTKPKSGADLMKLLQEFAAPAKSISTSSG